MGYKRSEESVYSLFWTLLVFKSTFSTNTLEHVKFSEHRKVVTEPVMTELTPGPVFVSPLKKRVKERAFGFCCAAVALAGDK